MPVTIVSTDSDKDVQAAVGVPKEVVEAAPVKADETLVVSETAVPETDTKPKKTNLQKRIDKLSKAKAEAIRRADYWEQEAKRKADAPAAPQSSEKKVESTNEPGPDDFDKHSDYVKALVKYEANQRDVLNTQKAKETEVKVGLESARKSYGEKEREFKKSVSDYQERLDAVEDVEMSLTVRDRILKSGPELAYALAEDPEEFKRICSLSPSDALEEIGEVKARMKSQAKMKVEDKPESKPKPKPVSPVGSKVASEKDPDKMTITEYDAWRRAGNSP